MANILNVNGFSVEIADAQLTRNLLEIGRTDSRSMMQQRLDNRRGIKRTWACKTPLMAGVNADALENWLLGIGWHVSFETGYASVNGLQPSAGYNGILSTAQAKFGSRSWKGVASTDGFAYRYPIRTRSNDWTATGWHYRSAWQHWAITSKQGTVVKHLAGAVTGATLGFHANSTPTMNTILSTFLSKDTDGTAMANIYFDELTFFPWALTASMVSALAAATVAMGALPKLSVTGALIRELGPITCRASITGVDHENVGSDIYRAVTFNLEEV